jgi:hypothetical protein
MIVRQLDRPRPRYGPAFSGTTGDKAFPAMSEKPRVRAESGPDWTLSARNSGDD